MPLDVAMADVMTQNADLLDEPQVPPVLPDICAHVTGYQPIIKRREAGDFSENSSVVNFPRGRIEEFAFKEFSRLKKEQRARALAERSVGRGCARNRQARRSAGSQGEARLRLRQARARDRAGQHSDLPAHDRSRPRRRRPRDRLRHATGKSPDAVLFSGEPAFSALFDSAATVALSTLALLIVFKGLAWSISLGSFRGGPTFPAIFRGVVAGPMAAHLPGYGQTGAVAALVGASCVSVLRLPLSSAMIALLLSIKAGLAVAPLVIVAYLAGEALNAYVDSRVGARTASAKTIGREAEVGSLPDGLKA